DCINAHATSTPKGDAAEMQALHDVFGERLSEIPVVANKSQLGHSMGACSILELIVAVEGMNAGIVSPTLNYVRDPLLPEALVPAEAMERQHRRTLMNSFGFGGTNTSLVVGLP
ncbi:MAG TPA: beta-ketoacyl-ACP synthase, partial [Pyrinomonadaceae bacterium]|nr:beta-ketoacyl-ACP synthase [Pyrinomonadaceae bacterium]